MLYRQIGPPARLAYALRHEADILRESCLPAEAEPLYLEAEAIYRQQGEEAELDLANTLRGLALVYESSGKSDAARSLFEQARALYAKCSVQAGVAAVRGETFSPEVSYGWQEKAVFEDVRPARHLAVGAHVLVCPDHKSWGPISRSYVSRTLTLRLQDQANSQLARIGQWNRNGAGPVPHVRTWGPSVYREDWSARGFVEVSVQVLLCDFERRFGLLQPGGEESTLQQRDNQSREGFRIHQGIISPDICPCSMIWLRNATHP